ncbi:hypothetical protein BC751_0385 [Cecembia calidifontis]|jgi:hypothetical protein|uniref:Uncharacterized protein n=1 Tax=Cecembia calidifontis TaxID=1187080 RepID=A0A4Q7P4Q1_9BACT|nr:hypothetical protein BC751_0385 [Cecembia calidifontis]
MIMELRQAGIRHLENQHAVCRNIQPDLELFTGNLNLDSIFENQA